MNKTDENAVKWAIEKYWREKTDKELALGLKVTETVVKKMREQMGYEREQKGKTTLKEFARKYLLELSEEDKMDFIRRLPADLIWKMAEGNPATSGSLDIGVEPIKIDITHQLLKVYGTIPTITASSGSDDSEGERAAIVPEYREISGVAKRPSE